MMRSFDRPWFMNDVGFTYYCYLVVVVVVVIVLVAALPSPFFMSSPPASQRPPLHRHRYAPKAQPWE